MYILIFIDHSLPGFVRQRAREEGVLFYPEGVIKSEKAVIKGKNF